jgi:hypothetical protein
MEVSGISVHYVHFPKGTRVSIYTRAPLLTYVLRVHFMNTPTLEVQTFVYSDAGTYWDHHG